MQGKILIKEVKDKQTNKQFIDVAYLIYKDDPNWIAPLENDINDVFNPLKNPALKEHKLKRWIATQNGKLVGRIAAFYNQNLGDNSEKVGAIGFFEAIDSKDIAYKLFDVAKDWLLEEGMDGMDGPINLGERDKFWGCLQEKKLPPSYQEAYNPPYYNKFFSEYGFEIYFEQLTYLITREGFKTEMVSKINNWLARKSNYEFKTLQLKHLKKYTKDFVEIYNHAWKKFENFSPVDENIILSIFKSIKPIIVEEYIWFAYVDNKPAGFLVILPDLNELFKYNRGKFNLWNKVLFLIRNQFHKYNKTKALVFGIHPDYQKSGIDAGLISHFANVVNRRKEIKSCEIAWVGSFNPQMQSLMQKINGSISKVHNTYRLYFDINKKVERYKLGSY
jgi:hypothetical protein